MKGLIFVPEKAAGLQEGDFCTVPMFHEKHADELQNSMQTSPHTLQGTTPTHSGIGPQIPKSSHKDGGPRCGHQHSFPWHWLAPQIFT